MGSYLIQLKPQMINMKMGVITYQVMMITRLGFSLFIKYTFFAKRFAPWIHQHVQRVSLVEQLNWRQTNGLTIDPNNCNHFKEGYVEYGDASWEKVQDCEIENATLEMKRTQLDRALKAREADTWSTYWTNTGEWEEKSDTTNKQNEQFFSFEVFLDLRSEFVLDRCDHSLDHGELNEIYRVGLWFIILLAWSILSTYLTVNTEKENHEKEEQRPKGSERHVSYRLWQDL